MRLRSYILIGLTLFLLGWIALLLIILQRPAIETFSGDADAYNRAAVNLLQQGAYSRDGVHPYTDREPGQSVWLAGIFSVFGVENRVAIFVLQGMLFVLASYLFIRELRHVTSERVAGLCFLLLLLFPANFHIIFTANRECLALSLFLLLATELLRWLRLKQTMDAFAAGVLMGLLILTYMAYLFLPIPLLLLFLFWRARPVQVFLFVLPPLLMVSAWAMRNQAVSGHACLTGCQRTAAVWYVRGEQAERLHGFEPVMCLWAEYISRDWSHRSDACSFNGLKNRKWPEGFKPEELQQDLAIAAAGKQKVLAHFGNYLWFSVVDTLELHLPFVDSWGFRYNLSAAIGSVILYIGCLFGLTRLRRREFLLLLLFAAYTTGVFVLTDATPRYLMPVIFAYAAISAVGYDRLLPAKKWPT